MLLWPRDFTLVSHLFPLSPVHSACSGRMILDLSSTCLPSVPSALGRMDLHLSPTSSRRPLWVLWAAGVSSAYSGCTWPDVFTLVSASLFACSMLRPTWPNDFSLDLDTLGQRLSAGCTCLHLSFCLSPCLDALGRMILHLSSTCPPGGLSPFVSLLVTLVFHLSPCLSPLLLHLFSLLV